jgi:uncharacterized protein YneF (UPF0154 family)
MDSTLIVVIIFIAVFCLGGPIIGHYASKVSTESTAEKINKNKQN